MKTKTIKTKLGTNYNYMRNYMDNYMRIICLTRILGRAHESCPSAKVRIKSIRCTIEW